jgi:hypothetical protein
MGVTDAMGVMEKVDVTELTGSMVWLEEMENIVYQKLKIGKNVQEAKMMIKTAE